MHYNVHVIILDEKQTEISLFSDNLP